MTDISNSDKLTTPFRILRLIRAASPELQDRILAMLTHSEYARKAAETRASQVPSKRDVVVELMRRPEGATREEALKVTGWPAISMRDQAESAGYVYERIGNRNGARHFAKGESVRPFR